MQDASKINSNLPAGGMVNNMSIASEIQTEEQAERGKIFAEFGANTGIIGAILLALNISISAYGYLFFLISSVSLAYWGQLNNYKHQRKMQIVFTVVNSVGLYRWLVVG